MLTYMSPTIVYRRLSALPSAATLLSIKKALAVPCTPPRINVTLARHVFITLFPILGRNNLAVLIGLTKTYSVPQGERFHRAFPRHDVNLVNMKGDRLPPFAETGGRFVAGFAALEV
mmetsp:Transcript_2882/g.8207  ORF Transcript_2882/g.8207 Transcript_2882/m.8207 type:complete len:117 (-) Transcript_2882:536-886(-)